MDTPQREFDVAVPRTRAAATILDNRLLLAITFIAALVVGAIVALASDHWWLLLVPVGVHALGTMAVGFAVLQMTTQPESLDPRVTTLLEDEGVPEPDKAFNELVEEFTGHTDAAGTTEVIAAGNNEDRQRTAMTPSADRTASAGEGSPILGIQWLIVGSLAVASIVEGAIIGGLGWLGPAVVVPFCVAWIAYQAIAERKQDHQDDHPPATPGTSAGAPP